MTAAARIPTRWQLAALPRDARDTLFVLAVIAWIVLPHLGHLPVWCIALTAGLLLWRGRLAVRQSPLPSRWWVLGLLVLTIGATFWTHGTLLGKSPGVTMVILLLALKTLEMRARRDAFVVFFLGFFAVLTNFLYSQSLLVALAMVIAVIGLLTALVLAHMPVGTPALGTAARLAGRMSLLGLPIMVVLFVLFPRIGPLWGLPQDALTRTGLSEEMRLGDVAEVALDDRIAAVLRFDPGVFPSGDQLYLRGPVLARFDGVHWRVALRHFVDPDGGHGDVRVQGEGLRYEMTLEPTRARILPLLEVTPELPDLGDAVQARMRDDLHWRTREAITERLRVDAVAWSRFQHGPTQPVPALRADVELPHGFNPRTLQYAADLRRDPRLRDADARTLAAFLLDRIRTDGYTYTLAPGLYGRHAIDEFWFDRREGFCEHFAAAFVVLMRALDVPARIVTGFQGAERNPYDGTYAVRNSHAHAWAEFWQPGEGWVRADPTGAVAPDRIRTHQPLHVSGGALRSAMDAISPTLWHQFRAAWEAIDNGWNQWVLDHNRARQFDLLKRLGFAQQNWQELAGLIAAALVFASLAGAAWSVWDQRQHDPWLRHYARIRRRLSRAGVPAPAHVAPRTLARQVQAQLGERGAAIADLLLQLEQARYAGDLPPRAAAKLASRIDASVARALRA